MATDENNHKNEARDDWTGCTFRVERGPSSEGRAWGEPRERRPGRPRGHLLRMVSAPGVYPFALADTTPVLRRRDTAVYCHAVASSSTTPRVVSSLPPALIRSSQSKHTAIISKK
jgi:hypothetical protein